MSGGTPRPGTIKGRRRGRLDGHVPPSFRLAVGLGDSERERVLLPSLGESGEFVIAERCLAADQLLACIRGGRVDAALVAFDLHRLTNGALVELARTRTPLVLLAPPAEGEEHRQILRGLVLPPDAPAEAVREALAAAMRGERTRATGATQEPATPADEPAREAEDAAAALSVIAVAGGHGSPGRTTVAVNLAAALGAVAPTVLVDTDLAGPSIAAVLDADPTRNLSMLAHAEPATPHEWGRAIAQETQPLAARSPHGTVLCGVPKPELRAAVPARFLERLVTELQRRYRYVILDVGADVLGAEAVAHHTVLALAGQILVVTAADLVGLWRARAALALLKTRLQRGPEHMTLVINRHDRRHHHGLREIEWALGVPVAAVIPYDHRGVQRALAAQRPVVVDHRSRAGRALLDLAERAHGGRVVLPPEPTAKGRVRWPRWPVGMFRGRPERSRRAMTEEKGAPDGDGVTRVR
ncbi:MAG: CpaE family protein [Dehalococcoidia bacterium]